MQDEVKIKPASQHHLKENKGIKWRNVMMWSLWTLYIGLAVAVAIARGDGPQGQGIASARVEALLSKMTIEDKARALFVMLTVIKYFRCNSSSALQTDRE